MTDGGYHLVGHRVESVCFERRGAESRTLHSFVVTAFLLVFATQALDALGLVLGLPYGRELMPLGSVLAAGGMGALLVVKGLLALILAVLCVRLAPRLPWLPATIGLVGCAGCLSALLAVAS